MVAYKSRNSGINYDVTWNGLNAEYQRDCLALKQFVWFELS